MNTLQKLVSQLEKIIASEDTESLSTLGSYILGAIFEESQELYNTNSIVERISNLASNLEVENGSVEELEADWKDIKKLTESLKNTLV